VPTVSSMVDAGDWAGVERELTRLAAAEEFSGTVLVTRGSETLLEVAAGYADRSTSTPLRVGTRFGLASLSKPFTAAAVLDCARQGLLRLDDRVVDLLPASRRPRTLSPPVTVRHLLTHTSGIGDYAEEDPDLPGYVEDYGSLWRDLPSYRMERADDFLPLYVDAAPVCEAGREFHYCNAGYVLLAAVLEQVTGHPFAGIVVERVFTPAGMDGAGYPRLDEAHPDVAQGYLPAEGDRPRRTNIYSVPVVGGGDGGAVAGVWDLDRFLRAVASGSLLGEEATRQLLGRHVPVGEHEWIGLGLFVGPDWFGHGGGDPGVETGARFFPGTDTALVVLCNEEGCLDLAWDLVEAALGVA
jgi:D-alanyl-D-alanine carboxypeptidase